MSPSAGAGHAGGRNMLALAIVLVATLIAAGLVVLIGSRGSTALLPKDEPLPGTSADASAASDRMTTSHPSASAVVPSEPGNPNPAPAQESESPEPATTDLSWTLVAAFGDPGGTTSVDQVVPFNGGFVAVGTESANPVMPEHEEGRVWLSADGREWADVTPPGLFVDTSFVGLIVADDSTLVAFGTRFDRGDDGGYYPTAAVSWTTRDGREWQPTESGLPELVRAPQIVSGALGHLALIGEADSAPRGICPKMYCFFELWYSSDGRHWERVRSLDMDARVVVAAGTEGFVAAGIAGAAGQPYVFASGDGKRWFEAPAPPRDIIGLAAIDGDWLVLTGDSPTGGAQPSTVWRSANGLDWQQIGDLPLGTVAAGAGDCRERAGSLYSAKPWIVAATGLDDPCLDVHRFASLPGWPRLSVDGTTWVPLPLAGADGDRAEGVGISVALAIQERLLLAGTSDGMATFWIGEP